MFSYEFPTILPHSHTPIYVCAYVRGKIVTLSCTLIVNKANILTLCYNKFYDYG